MTTCGAAEGKTVWYIKLCLVNRQGCRDWRWDHLHCEHKIVSDKFVESLRDGLEFGTYIDHGAEDSPTPPMPTSALTPKQPAMPPPSVKNEPAENASSSSKRRKVETPDKAPALKSEDDDTVEIRNDVVLAINAADEPADEPPAPEPDEDTIEIGPDVMAALMHAMRLFAVTMDDAVATLGEAATTMSNFLKGQFK